MKIKMQYILYHMYCGFLKELQFLFFLLIISMLILK